MVYLPRLRVGAPSHNALDEDLIRHVKEDEGVGGDTGGGESVGLRWRAGEAVKEPAGGVAVVFGEAIFDLMRDGSIR